MSEVGFVGRNDVDGGAFRSRPERGDAVKCQYYTSL